VTDYSERVRLPAVLETSLAMVREWLVRAAGAQNPKLDLRRKLGAVLINLLEVVEEDTAIISAVNQIYAAATAYQEQVNRASRVRSEDAYNVLLKRAQAMDAALAELRAALVHAKPSSLGTRGPW
jgi:hypothetical protein